MFSFLWGDSSHSTLVGQRRRSGRWRGSSSDGLLCFSSRMRERWRERERRRRLGNVAHVAMEKDAGLDLGETTLFCSINHRCAHHWQSSGRSWGVHILLSFPLLSLQPDRGLFSSIRSPTYNISWEPSKDRSVRNTFHSNFLERHYCNPFQLHMYISLRHCHHRLFAHRGRDSCRLCASHVCLRVAQLRA